MSIKINKTTNFKNILNLNQKIFEDNQLNVTGGLHGWIAVDLFTNQQIGFCTITNLGHGIFFLSRAGLLPSYYKRGIHKRFIRLREKFARKNKAKKIITYVYKENYQSLINLIKLNYYIYEPEWDYAGDEFIYLIKYL